MESSFTQLKIRKEFIDNINSLGFEKMTNIQSLCIGKILDKNDVVAQAKTGSGKTAAFSIPIIENLDVKEFDTQALIIVPTRELANQVATQIRKLARHIHNIKVLCLTGGVPYKAQVESLRFGAHIIVGTPGRLMQHLFETKVRFEKLTTLVLDEADKMLDMGFYDDIIKIIETLPSQRQNLLFSATFEENIKSLTKSITNNAIFVKDETIHKEVSIKQRFFQINEDEKSKYVIPFIKNIKSRSTLIFCNTKVKCDELANYLYENGLDVLVLHSDMDQKDRDEIIILFSNKSYPILIATDIASRGLDIDDVELVINYDLARDLHTHLHRIGRTARAGKSGIAVSFVSDEDDNSVQLLEEKFTLDLESVNSIEDDGSFNIDADYRTLYLNSGKKHKLRAGDILGALTAGIGLDKNDVGVINILPFCSYVAIKKECEKKAFNGLRTKKIKNKNIKVYTK